MSTFKEIANQKHDRATEIVLEAFTAEPPRRIHILYSNDKVEIVYSYDYLGRTLKANRATGEVWNWSLNQIIEDVYDLYANMHIGPTDIWVEPIKEV